MIQVYGTYNERVELARDEQEDRDRKQQQLDNAKARYSGMFGTKGPFGIGGGRLGRDKRRAKKGKLNPYEASALAGELGAGADIDQWTSGQPTDEYYAGGTFDEGEGWG